MSKLQSLQRNFFGLRCWCKQYSLLVHPYLHEHVMCIRTTHHSLKNVFANDRNTYQLRPYNQEKKLSTSHFIMNNVVFQFSHIAILLVISTLWNLQQSPRGLTSFGTIFSYSDKIFWEICVIRFYFDNEICRNLQQSWIKQRQSCQNSMKTYYAPIWRFCVTFAWL